MESEANSKPIAVVQLENPTEVSNGISKYTQYQVTVTKLGDDVNLEDKTVVRRYSDFANLNEILQGRYSGMLIPPIPEKRMMGKMKNTFIKVRMKELERFLCRLLANPYIQCDDTLQKFLTLEQKDWAIFVKEGVDRKIKPAELMDSNDGIRRWEEVKHAMDESKTSQSVFDPLLKELKELEASLTRVCSASVGAAMTSKAYVDARDKAVDAVQKHGLVCQEISADCAGFLPTVATNMTEASKILSTAGRALDSWKALYDSQPADIIQYVAESARDDLQHVKAFQQLIRRFHGATNNLKGAFKKKDGTAFKYESLKKKGKFDEAQKMEIALASLQEQLESAQNEVQMQARGILCSELQRYCNWRYANTRRYLAQFAVTSLESAEREIQLWQRVLDELEVDPDDISEMARRTVMAGDMELQSHSVPADLFRLRPIEAFTLPETEPTESVDEEADNIEDETVDDQEHDASQEDHASSDVEQVDAPASVEPEVDTKPESVKPVELQDVDLDEEEDESIL